MIESNGKQGLKKRKRAMFIVETRPRSSYDGVRRFQLPMKKTEDKR